MAQENNSNMTVRLLSYVFVVLVAFAGGFLVGNLSANKTSGDTADATGAAANPSDATANKDNALPLEDSPVRGKKTATVTIVEFSDFQCPFCARGRKTMDQLLEKYPNDVKVSYKFFPLPFHPQAMPAAKAAVAAKNQGKFWKMHDFLFDHQKEFRSHGNDFESWITGQAKSMGMNAAQFKKDFESPKTAAVIKHDQELGHKVNVRGTPHFFVNGVRVRGAKPLPSFEQIVKQQIEAAKGMLKQAGVTRANLYGKLVAKNYDGGQQNNNNNNNAQNQRKPPAQTVEYVPVSKDDPTFGNTKDPLVTIVEFSDFQCPFCARVAPTVDKLKKEYGNKIRFTYMTMPLSMHPQAQVSAQAAMAAHMQGKFWPMYDALFEHQKEFRQHANDFKDFAAGLAKKQGMNVAKFKKDFDSPKVKAAIDKAQKLAQKVGARGTPNFWINGINVRGAQPYARFKSTIDDQIKKAQALKAKKHLSGDALYKAIVAENKANAPKPSAPQRRPQPAAKVPLSKLTIGNAPVRGPKTAPVTIVEFADFQCPYCKRGGDNLHEALQDFKGKVKVVWKNYPLPFHQHAKPAAHAALAAREQGKFWQMHDLLFENQSQLGQDGIYEKLAKQIGLNMAKFKKDLNNPNFDKVLQADTQQGQTVGVSGTPAFFINGTRVIGAQPTAKFKAVIAQALKEAKK